MDRGQVFPRTRGWRHETQWLDFRAVFTLENRFRDPNIWARRKRGFEENTNRRPHDDGTKSTCAPFHKLSLNGLENETGRHTQGGQRLLELAVRLQFHLLYLGG